MKNDRIRGSSVTEVAIVMPVLLMLIGGGYAACRSAFLKSRAESVAQAEALRVGRRLSGLERPMAESILPDGSKVTVRAEGGSKAGVPNLPLPLLSGRTRVVVRVVKEWNEAGTMSDLTRLDLTKRVEASIDCWDRGSSSGKKIRGAVTGVVAMAGMP